MKRPTEQEFISELMNPKTSGELAPMFIIEAIYQYCNAVISTEPEGWKQPLIKFDVWQKHAVEMKEKWNQRYGKEK